MQYLIKIEDRWHLADEKKATRHGQKHGARSVIEIRSDELMVIFIGDLMQVFTAEKELERLYLKANEDKYTFGGKILGKYRSDIFVYKRNK